MKNILICMCFLIMSGSAFAQNVDYGEYFIDEETGFGNGTPFTIAAPDSDITQAFTIPYSDFPSPGFHFVFFRMRDALGNWSITRRKAVEVDDNSAAQEVIQVEYFFTDDNGFGGNTIQTLTPSLDSTWTFDIPYANVPATWDPNDTLYLRVKENVKVGWSLTAITDSMNYYYYLPGTDELVDLVHMSVYPNPFHDAITLDNTEPGTIGVRIFNEAGAEVWTQLVEGRTVIPTNDWAAGVYLFLVKTGDGRGYQSKIIRQ